MLDLGFAGPFSGEGRGSALGTSTLTTLSREGTGRGHSLCLQLWPVMSAGRLGAPPALSLCVVPLAHMWGNTVFNYLLMSHRQQRCGIGRAVLSGGEGPACARGRGSSQLQSHLAVHRLETGKWLARPALPSLWTHMSRCMHTRPHAHHTGSHLCTFAHTTLPHSHPPSCAWEPLHAQKAHAHLLLTQTPHPPLVTHLCSLCPPGVYKEFLH